MLNTVLSAHLHAGNLGSVLVRVLLFVVIV